MPRAFAVACVLTFATTPALADARIFEQNPGSEWNHRWVDLTAYVQPGFIVRQNDENAPITDDHFWLQRARFGFRARMEKWLSLRMEVETTPTPVLQDAYVDFEILPPWLSLRAGQFQLAFLRTFQFSEVSLAFIDRTLFVPAGQDRDFLRYLSPRDIGIMFTGRVGDTSEGATSMVLEYWLGMFLGRGPNQIRNDDDAFLYSARLQLHARGLPEGGDAESDLARNESPRVAVGGGVYTNCDDRGQWNRGFTVDAELRFQGIFASAAYVWFRNGASEGLGQTLGYDGEHCGGLGTPGAEHIARGASVQAQYVFPQIGTQSIEALVRIDWVQPWDPIDAMRMLPTGYFGVDDPPERIRYTVGVNWFPTSRQALKLSLNYQHNEELEHVLISSTEVIAIDNDIIWLQLTAGL